MEKYISFSILFYVEIVHTFLKDCSLSFLSLPGPKAVWGASSPSICCHFREMSGEISVTAPFTSISVITCLMNGQAHNSSVGVSVCVSRLDQIASSERCVRSPIRRLLRGQPSEAPPLLKRRSKLPTLSSCMVSPLKKGENTQTYTHLCASFLIY